MTDFQQQLSEYKSSASTENAQAITEAIQEQLCLPSASSILRDLIPFLQNLAKEEPLAELLAFEVFPYVSPCVALPAYRDLAREAVLVIGQVASSPRELFLAICERLSALGDTEDEEEEQEGETGREVHEELVTLLNLTGTVLERINSKKPAAFLLDFRSRLLPTLKSLSFAQDRKQEVLSAVCSFTRTIHARSTFLKEEEQLKTVSALSFILLGVLGVLNPGAGLSATWFRKRFPRLAHPNLQTLQAQDEPDSARFWRDLQTSAIELDLTVEKLLEHASAALPISEDEDDEAPTPAVDHSSKAGAFILLCHLTQEPGLESTFFSAQHLNKTFGLILAYLNHQSTACDEALVGLFSVVEESIDDITAIDETRLFLLVERLGEVAAFSSDPSIRLVAFKLLSRLVKDYASDQEDLQLIMLKELLFEAPSESLKSAVVGLLREVLADKFASPAPSIFKTPVLLEEYLLPLLQSFCFPATSLEELSSTLLIQCLNLYYFILCSDSDNKTGLRSTSDKQSIEQSFFSPLGHQLRIWQEDPVNDSPALGDLPAIEMILDRILEKEKTLKID